MKKTKLLIDTDIGDEIDDALALYFAMRQGLDIVGITTVFQNTDERARIAKRLIALYGNGYESVPVYAGCGTPMAEADRKYGHTCHYTSELERVQYAPDGNNATDFIIEQCKKWGKDLTVVAIGPFTNIAKVIEKDPSALSKVNKVVIMGGAFFKQYADWNVSCDVEAADVMFKSLDNLECIGADVTHKLPLDPEQFDELCRLDGNEAAREVAKLCRLWREATPNRLPALHDPLAIYYAVCPTVCQIKEQGIVTLKEGFGRGLTLNVTEYNKAWMNPIYKSIATVPLHKVAYEVDKVSFMKVFFSYVK